MNGFDFSFNLIPFLREDIARYAETYVEIQQNLITECIYKTKPFKNRILMRNFSIPKSLRAVFSHKLTRSVFTKKYGNRSTMLTFKSLHISWRRRLVALNFSAKTFSFDLSYTVLRRKAMSSSAFASSLLSFSTYK